MVCLYQKWISRRTRNALHILAFVFVAYNLIISPSAPLSREVETTRHSCDSTLSSYETRLTIPSSSADKVMLRKLRSDNLNQRKRNTIVKQSLIQGKGLFAARDFLAGEMVEVMIGYIQGELETPSKSKYSIMLRGGKRILVLTNKSRHINRSAHPNVRLSLTKDCVLALRAIQSGEELTCRYDSLFG